MKKSSISPSTSNNSIVNHDGYSIQIEYLKKLQTNHLLSLKQNCLISISKIILDQFEEFSINNVINNSSSSNNNTNPYISSGSSSSSISRSISNKSLSRSISNNSLNSSGSGIGIGIGKLNLDNLSIDLKQELIHFMLEFRLLYNSNILNSSNKQLSFQSIIDNKIKSLDFSVVKSKITIGDPTKDILKLCTNIKNIDFSNCYNVNDSFLKIIINNLQSSSSSSNNNSSYISPPLLSKSKSIEFNDKLSSLESSNSSDDHLSNSGLPPLTPLNTTTTTTTTPPLTPRKQKRFSLKNKIFSKKKQQDEITTCNITTTTTTTTCNNSQQSQQPIEELLITNNNNSTATITTGLTPISIGGSSKSFNFDNGLLFLSLKQCSMISDAIIRKLIKLSPNLQYLDITGCKITPKTLLTITTTCIALKTLNIGHIEFPLTTALAQSISKLTNLASLDLSCIPKLNSQILNSILIPSNNSNSNNNKEGHNNSSSNNNLDSLYRGSFSEPPTPRDRNHHQQQYQQQQHFNQLPPLSPTSSSNSINMPLIKKINLSPSIQSLASISSASSNLYTPRSMLSFELLGAFPNTLLSINLSQSDIDDVGLLVLSKKCIYLQDLDISFCTKITNQGLSDMSNYLSTLVTFSAKIVKASYGLVDLITGNTNLIKLDLQHTKLEESHLREISNCQLLSNLISIRLDGTPISDEIFKKISTNNQSLEIIGLSSCKNITIEIFNILGNNCKNLKKLYLSHCKMNLSTAAALSSSSLATNNNLQFFFNQCIQLNLLDIAFTPLIKDTILQIFIDSKCSKSIEALFIGGGFHNLNSSIINQLVLSTPRIKLFSCISCYNIKDDAILLAMKKWLLLEALELTDCTSLTTITTNFIANEPSHIHSHLRFLFFSNLNLDENLILNKIKENSSLEIFEINQEITLENVIDQGWINI